MAWPSSLLILLIFLSTPTRSGQATSQLRPLCCQRTRAGRHYSQGVSRTQAKTTKKAGKMQIFLDEARKASRNAGSAAPGARRAGPAALHVDSNGAKNGARLSASAASGWQKGRG